MTPRSTFGQHAAVQAWRKRWDTTAAQARAWWLQRQPRERLLLKAGGAVIGLAVVWLAMVRPSLDTMEQSRTQLPALRAQSIQVNALILEAQALQHGQSGRIDPSAMQDAILGSLRRIGIDDRADLQAMDTGGGPPKQWDVRLDDANATRVIEWLAELPVQLQLRIREVELNRAQRDGRERPGNVSGLVRLELPQEPQ